MEHSTCNWYFIVHMYSFFSICGLNDSKKWDSYKKINCKYLRRSYVYYIPLYHDACIRWRCPETSLLFRTILTVISSAFVTNTSNPSSCLVSWHPQLTMTHDSPANPPSCLGFFHLQQTMTRDSPRKKKSPFQAGFLTHLANYDPWFSRKKKSPFLSGFLELSTKNCHWFSCKKKSPFLSEFLELSAKNDPWFSCKKKSHFLSGFRHPRQTLTKAANNNQ